MPDEIDVLLTGTVFYDIVFTGMDRLPAPGEEIWTGGMGSSPGGIANLAVATARLGLSTGLAAGFGDDSYADWMWQTLSEDEGIDLSASRRFERFHTAVTVSMAFDGDRAMVTHGHPLPESLDAAIADAPRAKAAIVDLAGDGEWWAPVADRGTRIIADIGFDTTGRWDVADLAALSKCAAFTPNAGEAMAYARAESPLEAARKLAELVPLVVVTDGPRGAVAVDSASGREFQVSGVPVDPIDTTGAGDVFCAGMTLGLVREWPLDETLRFASLCAALAVQQFGGSLAAPGWGDIVDWHNGVKQRAEAGDRSAAALHESYAFLCERLPQEPTRRMRRAEATFALSSDASRGRS